MLVYHAQCMHVWGTLWMQPDNFPAWMTVFYWDGSAPFLVLEWIQAEQVSLFSVYFCRTCWRKDLFMAGAPECVQVQVRTFWINPLTEKVALGGEISHPGVQRGPLLWSFLTLEKSNITFLQINHIIFLKTSVPYPTGASCNPAHQAAWLQYLQKPHSSYLEPFGACPHHKIFYHYSQSRSLSPIMYVVSGMSQLMACWQDGYFATHSTWIF